MSRIPRIVLALPLAMLAAGCGGDSGSTAPPPAISVSLSPASTTVDQGAATVLTATVANAQNGAVTWTTTGGQLSAQGSSATLVAPASAGSVTVTATSVEDPARSASATVAVRDVAVTVSAPETAALRLGQLPLSALVTGTVNTGVAWATDCDDFVHDGASATWTAPATVTTCQATATSEADPSKSASVELRVRPEFVVNATDDTADGRCDPAHCSLREAIMLALAEMGDGADSAQVRFASGLEGGTITLEGALPELTADLSLVGPGMDALTVDANGEGGAGRRHFRVRGGARVSIEGMTLTGGDASGTSTDLQTAGSLWVAEASHLHLRDVAVTENRASGLAAGIRVEGASTLRIEASRISRNETTNSAGGLLLFGNSEAVILNSEVTDNVAGIGSGGIWVSSSSMELYDSRVEGNQAGSSGGGMNVGASSLYMEGGVVARNRSEGAAGGGMIVSANSTVAMDGVMLEENHAHTSGGAIYVVSSEVRMSESELVGNTSATNAAGALYMQGASAELTDVVFRDNVSGAAAGAMAAYFESEARLVNVDFIGNQTPPSGNHSGGGFQVGSNSQLEYLGGRVHDNAAAAGGGGFTVAFSTALVQGLDVAGNRAGTFGGGIFQSGPGAVVVEASTVRDNEAVFGGGGLSLQPSDPSTTVRNVTVSGNRSRDGSGVRLGGQGRLQNVTLVGNVADPSNPTMGGALFALNNAVGFELVNVLLAENLTSGERRNCTLPPNGTAVVQSLGGNLSDDESCGVWLTATASTTPDLNGVEGGVAASLGDHGGPTLTHALLQGSAALGAGNPNRCPTTDQRGFVRGSACDIGAFQLDGAAQPLALGLRR